MKKPDKKWRMTIVLPADFRPRIKAKVENGEAPSTSWWIQSAIKTALDPVRS